MTTITIAGVKLTQGAAASVEETGIDIATDVTRVRDGLSADELLAECLDGVEGDDRKRRSDWQDYVEDVVAAARS